MSRGMVVRRTGDLTPAERAALGELAYVSERRLEAEHRINAHRQVGMHAAAHTVALRDMLRAVEEHNPDAAPEVAAIVRIATAGIIGAQLEFGGSV